MNRPNVCTHRSRTFLTGRGILSWITSAAFALFLAATALAQEPHIGLDPRGDQNNGGESGNAEDLKMTWEWLEFGHDFCFRAVTVESLCSAIKDQVGCVTALACTDDMRIAAQIQPLCRKGEKLQLCKVDAFKQRCLLQKIDVFSYTHLRAPEVRPVQSAQPLNQAAYRKQHGTPPQIH